MSKRHGAIRCVADIQEIADLKKRVEELAIELQKERERLAAYSQVHLRQVSKLQAARELAERVNNTGPRIAQVFDGWHNDGTAWTEYDESVRREVRELQVVAGKFMEGINP